MDISPGSHALHSHLIYYVLEDGGASFVGNSKRREGYVNILVTKIAWKSHQFVKQVYHYQISPLAK